MNPVPKALSDLTAVQPETSQAQAVATTYDQKQVNMKIENDREELLPVARLFARIERWINDYELVAIAKQNIERSRRVCGRKATQTPRIPAVARKSLIFALAFGCALLVVAPPAGASGQIFAQVTVTNNTDQVIQIPSSGVSMPQLWGTHGNTLAEAPYSVVNADGSPPSILGPGQTCTLAPSQTVDSWLGLARQSQRSCKEILDPCCDTRATQTRN